MHIDEACVRVLEQGHALMGQGQYREAISVFGRVVRHISDNHDQAVALGLIGYCYLKLNNPDEARLYFDEALRYDSEYIMAFLNLGRSAQREGNIDAAVEQYDRVIEINPGCDEAYSEKGVCLADKGMYNEAKACLVKAAVLCPDNAGYQGDAGIIYLRCDDAENALPFFVRQIRLSRCHAPEFASTGFVNAAQCYRAHEDFRRALKAVAYAFKLNPNNSAAYEEQAHLHMFNDEFSQAFINYVTALKLSKNQELIDCIEIAGGESGDFKEAVALCSQAQDGILSVDDLVEQLEALLQK
ncbi:tetratricopeptide repeat protein [Candidatus Woesearchaeota archaeon]|nr:tetratricopeptide repeat protein [Candidatus Woesearchaeota archaeon]